VAGMPITRQPSGRESSVQDLRAERAQLSIDKKLGVKNRCQSLNCELPLGLLGDDH